MKKIITVSLAAMLILSGCGSAPPTKSQANGSSSATAGAQPYVAMDAKGFQFQYWQVVEKGAQDEAKKLNIKITFQGPDNESDVAQQVDMVNADLAKKPAALCLAALSTTALSSQLSKAKSMGIPVIGFDSGVPNDSSGALVATAATDSVKAAAMAADHLFDNQDFKAALTKATTANPVVIGVLSQDATSASIIQRTTGFINEMVAKIQSEPNFANAVEVTGQKKYNKASSSPAKVNIAVSIPPSTVQSDVQNSAQQLLNQKNLIVIFASNEGAADGMLSATNDGSDLNRSTGKYKNLLVVGFDAGKNQKAAVKSKEFLGSITQDPYTIGVDAVLLASKAIKGEPVSNIDTGAKWYDSTNMDNPDIAQLLYN
ncbi:D-ribose-binding periplasmic protein precursor [Peptococcaceae bacterium CEB3]|nr:D-ribose-binding periplasmic protein precursor [Peptococcaceae bacterium CEB3]